MPFFEFLVWLDLRLNSSLPDHWWTFYSLGQWTGYRVLLYYVIMDIQYRSSHLKKCIRPHLFHNIKGLSHKVYLAKYGPWCSRYRRRKWTRRYEFKSWTRLIAFHIALIALGKVWIQLFSLQLWVNSRTD